jgi:hypothetical protein
MKAIPSLLVLIIITFSCKQADNKKSRIEYIIPETDTACRKEIDKAKKDFKKGELVYCNFHVLLRCESELTELLEHYDIKFENINIRELYINGQTNNCYCDYMKEQIEDIHGPKFADSLLNIADSMYISKNLDKTYEYDAWDKPPLFPGDTTLNPTDHSGLQQEFENRISYPANYKYKADKKSMAMIKVNLFVDIHGNAKVSECQFVFWNNKTRKEDFNQEFYPEFKRILIPLIEQTKWKPAKIKSFNVSSKSQLFIYLK